jgi:hypothetical protein
MRFAVMNWVSECAKPTTVFGVVDKDSSGDLPQLTSTGYWTAFCDLDEADFRFADAAREAIARHGFYVMGAGVTVTEAFGAPNKTPF